jgi:4'-phosphopantetheinyl transferase
MNRIFFLEVEPVANGFDYNGMLRDVSDYKKESIQKSRFEIDRKIRIFADLLLRCLLADLLGRRLKQIELQTSVTGKPYMAGSPLEFNLSHTRNAVAVALSDRPVGIDLEKIKTIDMKVAEYVCNDNELSWINGTGADQTLRFFNIWTKKEAWLKYEGTGLRGGLKALDVLAQRAAPILSTFVQGDYVISACAGKKYAPEDITILGETDLFKMWQVGL